jgi:hypothetical protein
MTASACTMPCRVNYAATIAAPVFDKQLFELSNGIVPLFQLFFFQQHNKIDVFIKSMASREE